ncbi:hypothetical protein [Chryseobacterium viscerum]|uniref:DUF3822 domain-containing protein n=1 Tax=Chryseobacterium viscerum TaxID=1037377 RepID=A0A5N4BME7_9FLAO|nr:hypothetical protein [Chryseobacterium viscerum]KAB1229586.1 hypothetical protein F8D52_16940 [Chryseobacterium viscerum]
MKIRFKNREQAALSHFFKDEHKVIIKEATLQGYYRYTLFNENLNEILVNDNQVVVTDHDMSDMIQRNDLGYGKEFYINQFLIELLPLQPGQFISTRSLWVAGKLLRFFEKYNYEIPDSYRDRVLNETYKMNLIEGFLMAINPYMERKFIGGNYFESFEFYKGKAISEIQLKINDSLNELAIADYKSLLKTFIMKSLHDTYDNEENSKTFSNNLFILIDSLFVYEITRIFSYKTFYDDCFVIEYQNEYYYLNQFWWG